MRQAWAALAWSGARQPRGGVSSNKKGKWGRGREVSTATPCGLEGGGKLKITDRGEVIITKGRREGYLVYSG